MHLPDLLVLVLSIKNKAVSVKTIKSSATHGTINIVANRQRAVSDSDREDYGCGKTQQQGMAAR